MKTTTIQKWGNSYAVRLPKAVLKKLKIEPGQAVEVKESADDKTFSIIPIRLEEAELADLVAHITPNNQHCVSDWGTPVGKEVW